MASIQRFFKQFHDQIRLSDENAMLREKRDIVLNKLASGLASLRADGAEIPAFTSFGQGSYSMGTGTVPLDRDYDIDHGIVFDLAASDFEDPVVVKKWVLAALDGHTDRVDVRRSCVTVYYHRGGETEYHVDLAVYASAEKNAGKLFLAKGKLQSADKHRFWEESDPRGLIDLVKSTFLGEDGKQFRRVVRYLKRWKDVRFPSAGNGAPPGIALTVLALNHFTAVKTVDEIANTTLYDDLASLALLLPAILGRFQNTWTSEDGLYQRVAVPLPVAPLNDVLTLMTAKQMATFKGELQQLNETLSEALKDFDEHSACSALAKEFGADFPVPEKTDTASRRARSVTSGGSSA